MVNEPVAWMFEYGTDRGDAVNGISWYPNVHFKKPDLSGLIRNIEPLYTHPAKTLTDEEIWNIWDDYKNFTDANGEYSEVDKELIFARAILKKASEK